MVNIGPALALTPEVIALYSRDKRAAGTQLLARVSASLDAVTVQAQDWRSLTTVRAARRLYEPAHIHLNVNQCVTVLAKAAAIVRFWSMGRVVVSSLWGNTAPSPGVVPVGLGAGTWS